MRVMADGRDFGRCWYACSLWPSALPLGLGFLWMIWDKRHQPGTINWRALWSSKTMNHVSPCSNLRTATNERADLDGAALRPPATARWRWTRRYVRASVKLADKVIAVELLGLGIRLYFLPHAQGVQVLSHYDDEPDTLLRGAPFSLLRLALSDAPSDELFAGGAEAACDTATGQAFQDILRALRLDWEELLARVAGDDVAQSGRARSTRVGTQAQHAAHTLEEDVREYLIEEAGLLVNRHEVMAFSTTSTPCAVTSIAWRRACGVSIPHWLARTAHDPTLAIVTCTAYQYRSAAQRSR